MTKKNSRLAELLEKSNRNKKPRERYLILSARIKDEIEGKVKSDLEAGVSPTVLLNEALERYYAETAQ